MRIGRTYIVSIALAGLLASGAFAGSGTIVPLGDYPPFSLDYDLLYRNAILEQDFSLLSPVGPVTTEFGRGVLKNDSTPLFEIFDIRENSRANLFAIATERYRTTKDAHGNDVPRLFGGFAYHPQAYFSAVSFFNLDRAKALDPDYTGKKYRGLAGNLETSLLTFHKGKFTASLGRTRVFWGPQRVNLIMSETAEPLDLITAGYSQGRFSFNFIFARLDGSTPDAVDSANYPEASFIENRYLAGHRIDIRVHKRVRIGLFETVLYGGEGRPPELYYLNPLQFFHSAQLNEDENDNTILGGDFTALLGKGTSAYGQILIDDFQIDDASRGDNEPNEIGLMMGVFKAGTIGSFIPDIKAEYVRITNRTYHQREPRNRYLFRNKLIGHPLGPDADSVAVTIRFWPTRQFYAEVELAYRRHGEGSIYNSWDEPWTEVDDYTEPFPTGTIEKAKLAAIRAGGYMPFSTYMRKHFYVSLDAGIGDIENYGNIPGLKKTTGYLDLSLTWLGFTSLNPAE
ncbi:MAG: capsule assembly Wzi family protein [Candidatus Zixiibacteriota bacterium]